MDVLDYDRLGVLAEALRGRSLEATSPRLAKWVRERYRPAFRPRANKIIMLPRSVLPRAVR